MTDIKLSPLANFQFPSQLDPKAVSAFSIERTKSYIVKDSFHKIKHGDKVTLPDIFLIFDSYESAASFKCQYMLRPANLPKPITGELHFLIEKNNAKEG